jgi:hypothetical protein
LIRGRRVPRQVTTRSLGVGIGMVTAAWIPDFPWR